MRNGISSTKTQLSEWVFQASRKDPPSLDSPQPEVIEKKDVEEEQKEEEEEAVVIDKKDPILLALEKESSHFDSSLYLKKNDEITEGEQSLWITVEAYYQTRFENIRGNLVFKLDHLMFEAFKQKDKTDEE